MIRSTKGFWLAIPTPAAGTGAGGKRIDLGRWERMHGSRLRFVYRRSGVSLLVADAMRARMDEYGAMVKKVAAKHATLFVDTQAAFGNVLKEHHSAAFAWDRVHPNMTGHLILAKAFLGAIGAGGKQTRSGTGA